MKYRWNVLAVLLVAMALVLGALPTTSILAAPSQQEDDAILDRIAQITASPSTQFEDFRQPDDVWDVLDEEDYETYYYTGGYYIYVDAEELMAWGQSTIELSDFYLEVDAFHAFGPLDNQFGVVFRLVDVDNFYYFAASSDGYYRLRKMSDGEWSDLIAWTESDVIAIGEDSVNRLGLLAEGPQISILINGELLETVEDDSFADGFLGLAAGAFSEPEVEIAFDDMAIWDLTQIAGIDVQPNGDDGEEPAFDVAEEIAEARATTPLFEDDFSIKSAAWDTSPIDSGAIFYEDEALLVEVTAAETMVWALHQQIVNLRGEYLVEVDTALLEGPEGTDLGFVFDFIDSRNFSYFAIRDGTYSLWLKADNTWTSIFDWTESPAIEIGAGNRLGLFKVDSLYTLLVNDEVLTQTPADPADSGRIGLAVAANGDEAVTASFDNFVVWADDAIWVDEGVEPEPAPELPDLTATLAEIRDLDPDFSDDFRRDTGSWELSDDETASVAYASRSLEIEVIAENWLAWSLARDIESPLPSRYFFEFDSELVEGTDDSQYGVIFNFIDGDNYYDYTVSGQGTFSIWRKLDGEWLALQEWTATDVLETGPGAFNHLGILVEDGVITALANDVVLAQVEDDTLEGGEIGLVAGTYVDGGTVVVFDNVDYWVLE